MGSLPEGTLQITTLGNHNHRKNNKNEEADP